MLGWHLPLRTNNWLWVACHRAVSWRNVCVCSPCLEGTCLCAPRVSQTSVPWIPSTGRKGQLHSQCPLDTPDGPSVCWHLCARADCERMPRSAGQRPVCSQGITQVRSQCPEGCLLRCQLLEPRRLKELAWLKPLGSLKNDFWLTSDLVCDTKSSSSVSLVSQNWSKNYN